MSVEVPRRDGPPKKKAASSPPSDSSGAPLDGPYGRDVVIRVISSTYHLSQIALRELMRMIRQELPDFPPENLQVELGPYGAFDVRARGIVLCETSKTMLYPCIADIVAQLERVITAPLAEVDQSPEVDSVDSLEQQRMMLQQDEELTWDTRTPDELNSRTSSSSMASLDFSQQASDVQSIVSPDGVVVGVDPTDMASDTAECVASGGGGGGGGRGRGGGRQGIGVSIDQIGLGKAGRPQ